MSGPSGALLPDAAYTGSLSPNPLLDEARIREVLTRHWALDGRLSDLGSLQDQNVRVRSDRGTFVLKVVPATTDVAFVALQNAAMLHVAHAGPDFDSPRPIATADGTDIVRFDDVYCRLLTWVPGRPYAARPWLRDTELHALGGLNAAVALALTGFNDPRLDGPLVWDARRSLEVAEDLLPHLPEADLRDQVERAVQPLGRTAWDLPMAAIHGDVTPTNVTCADTGDAGHLAPAQLRGVVDFGDVMRTWRLADVAAATVGVVEHPGHGDPLAAALALLAGYHAVTPLTADEARAFWPMVLARAAVNAAISRIQSANNPSNWYALDGVASSLRALTAVAAVPPALADAGARAALGCPRPVPVPATVVELVPGLHAGVIADRSADSDALDDDTGDFHTDAGVSIVRWGEHRMDRAGELDAAEPANLQLGVHVHAPAGTPVLLPVDGEVVAVESRADVAGGAGDTVVVALPGPDELVLRLGGLTGVSVGPGTASAGTPLGTTSPGTPLTAQLARDADLPAFGDARNRAAWLEACPDPSAVLGRCVAAAAPTDVAVQQRRRSAHVAAPQHLYYEHPVEIVRGRRHFLYSAQGRGFLDMINNIAAVGHSHPGVTRAATRQLRRLNTNSRFLYDAMTRYSERLAQLLPPELSSIFLVNSGSEAADLALQLARTATGRHDVAAIAGAYHGWTGAVLALSSSDQDRPNWRAELQPGNHVVTAPNPYRPALGGGPADYVEDVARAARAAAEAGGLAAFVSEPLLGNQGAVEPFAGYLAGAYEQVRAAGGLCIADEVQVGMARTGDFWAFQHEGVVPDIVYTAKAAGNGHPVGMVACRPEVAERFDQQAAFFASTAGGPVSCEVGLAVLDAIRDERLQDNARTVGSHLKGRLRELAATEELIGAVHGRGLYQGVELVRDRTTKEPATAEAAAISERLRQRGVIMAPTGDAANVLKVKPPLCVDRAAADFFVEQLGLVLGELRHGAHR